MTLSDMLKLTGKRQPSFTLMISGVFPGFSED